MTTPVLSLPIFRAFDSAGAPLAGGLLYTYSAGSTTNKVTYSDATATTPNTNPVVLDSTGTATVRLGAGSYKFVLKDSNGSTQWTVDNYTSSYLTAGDIGALIWDTTTAENNAAVTPSYKQFPPGDVRRYGAVGNNLTDCTTAITSANAQAIQAGGSVVYFPRGTYKYKPAATLYIGGVLGTGSGWTGEDVYGTKIIVDTSSFTGVIFHQTGSSESRDIFISQLGGTKFGIGLRQGNYSIPDFTGHMRLTRVWVFGFNYNVDIQNVYMVTHDQVRCEDGAEGVYCVPDASNGNGYITTIFFNNCYYNSNTRNLYINPSVSSYDVQFLGGSIENATGSTQQAYFGKIFTLKLTGMYSEGATSIPWAYCSGVSVLSVDGLIHGAGQLQVVDSGAYCSFKNIQAFNAASVINVAGSTNYATVENCYLEPTGNTFPTGNTRYLNSYVNGVAWGIGTTAPGSSTLTLTGCTTSPAVSATYAISANGDTATLYIPTVAATSNTTACTLTGLSAAARPTADQFVAGPAEDNGVLGASFYKIGTGGTITLYWAGSATGFTNSGTKGCPGATLTYKLSA